MIKSFFIAGFRNMIRNRVPATINILGLSVALACGISIFLLIDSFYNLDTFHEKGDRLYLVMSQVKAGDETERWANTPYLLGGSLKEEQAAVESVARIKHISDLSVRHGDNVFTEDIWFTDSDFFNVFSYPLVYGSADALTKKSNIVITVDMARKYFGRDDATGEELLVRLPNGTVTPFTVGAVTARLTDKSSMFFSFLVPIENWKDLAPADAENWRTWVSSTFVVLRTGHTPGELQASMERYRKLQVAANERSPIQALTWLPIDRVARESYDLKDSLSWDIHPSVIITLAVIAACLVLLACFNYMNIAVASVSTRLKEIGIRKVIGGAKHQVIQQFMAENLLMCAIAMAFGAGLSQLFILPAFNTLYKIHIPFEFSSNVLMLSFFIGGIIIMGLFSGGYPALYVSSFNPVNILRGKQKFGNKSLFSRILLTCQFVLSFTTIMACFVSIASHDYFETKDWGYDHTDQIFMVIRDKKEFDKLKDIAAQQKDIVAYAGSESHIGYEDSDYSIREGEEDIKVTRFPIGFDYLETMGIRLQHGRFFDRSIASDKDVAIVVNNAFVQRMGWSEPLRESVLLNGVRHYVIGVTEDFYYDEFDNRLDPAFMHIVPEDVYRYFVVKTKPGTATAVSDYFRKNWASVSPDDPYEGRMQEDVFQGFYNDNRSDNKIMFFISMVALLLACMGLYGLVSHSLTRRMKEFSIRTIFGASLFDIFRLMNHDYMLIVVLSFVLGTPLGYYLMRRVLDSSFDEHIPVGVGPLVVTLVLLVLTIAFTLLTQLVRFSRERPQEMLTRE